MTNLSLFFFLGNLLKNGTDKTNQLFTCITVIWFFQNVVHENDVISWNGDKEIKWRVIVFIELFYWVTSKMFQNFNFIFITIIKLGWTTYLHLWNRNSCGFFLSFIIAPSYFGTIKNKFWRKFLSFFFIL